MVGLDQFHWLFLRHCCLQVLFTKLRNPKVEYLHIAVRPQHDILRFYVAMHDAGGMRRGERTGHLNCNLKRFNKLYASTREALTQRFAFDELAGNKTSGVIRADLVNG